MKRSVIAAGAVATLFLSTLTTAAAPPALAAVSAGTQTVFPTPTESTPRNPDKGWTLVDYALPASQEDNRVSLGPYWQRITTHEETLPEVPNVAIVSTWDELEPEEGVYDWELLDDTMDYWSAQGKKIHFRISTEPYTYALEKDDELVWDYHGGAPDWLRDVTDENGDPVDIPYIIRSVDADYYYDVGNETYQAKLAAFVGALADRYKTDPRVVLVDVRGYGTWGEWHSGYDDFGSVAVRADALKDVIDIWTDAWGSSKILALSNSYEFLEGLDPDVNGPTSQAEYEEWSAFDHAKTQPHLTFRRDGVAGAVRPYDKALLESSFRDRNTLPLITEFWRGYDEYSEPGGYNRSYSPDTAIDDALKYRPNYVTLMGWDADSSADEFVYERPDLIAQGTAAMGYNLVPTRVTLPTTIAAGASFSLVSDWKNTARGRAFRSSDLTTYLTDSAGNTFWSSTDTGFETRDIIAGSPQSFTSTYTLPSAIPAGTYDVRIAITGADGASTIAIGAQGSDELNRLRVGAVSVTGAAPAATPAPFLSEGFDSAPRWSVLTSSGALVTGASALNGTTSARGVGTAGNSAFVRTDPDRLRLRPSTSYDLSFAHAVSTTTGGSLRVVARSATLGSAGDVVVATGIASTSTATASFTTGDADDYVLEWQTAGAVTATIDSLSIEPESAPVATGRADIDGFEGGTFASSRYAAASPAASLTSSASEVVSGTKSVKGMSSASGYTEYLYSDPAKLTLHPLRTYEVSFTYFAHTAGDYYSLARSAGGGSGFDRGFTQKSYAAGDVGSEVIRFTTGNRADYFLVWGLFNGGSIAIDDIQVREVHVAHTDFENGTFAGTGFTNGFSNYGTITSGADRVNGDYSVSGSNDGSIEWFEFLYSDPAVVKLEGDHRYKVEVSYRQIEAPLPGGAYYTLARTPSGGNGNDVGFVQWFDEPETLGMKTSRTFVYDLEDYDDYFLIFGLHNGGKLTVDDITITEY
jgi:hypothetical protein